MVELDHLKDLTVAELQRECRARGLSDEGCKKDLQTMLKEYLGGVQWVPEQPGKKHR